MSRVSAEMAQISELKESLSSLEKFRTNISKVLQETLAAVDKMSTAVNVELEVEAPTG